MKYFTKELMEILNKLFEHGYEVVDLHAHSNGNLTISPRVEELKTKR